jgi:hypothetical protein
VCGLGLPEPAEWEELHLAQHSLPWVKRYFAWWDIASMLGPSEGAALWREPMSAFAPVLPLMQRSA